MIFFKKACVLFLFCVLASGCVNKKKVPVETPVQEAELSVEVADTAATPQEQTRMENFRKSYSRAMAKKENKAASKNVLRRAHSAIGTPYVIGGDDMSGFDCSGLVCWAYKSVGIKLPRTAREQSVVGKRVGDVSEMRAGDIVAFRHPRRGYHTGIYVGDGNFIHSPRRNTRVKVNSLNDSYFSSTFLGARRINFDGNEDLVAQAESRLSSAPPVVPAKMSKSRKSRQEKSRAMNSRRGKGGKSVHAGNRTSGGKKANSLSSSKPSGKKRVGKSADSGKQKKSVGKVARNHDGKNRANVKQTRGSGKKSAKIASAEGRKGGKKSSSRRNG